MISVFIIKTEAQFKITSNCTNHCKVKVRFSLCLTEDHTMKTYPVLNHTPRHENVLGSGGIFPRILNLGTKWRLVVSSRSGRFTLT